MILRAWAAWDHDTRRHQILARVVVLSILIPMFIALAVPLAASDDTGRKGLETSEGRQDPEPDERGYLLGVYGELLGIYDDVLDETREGPRTLQQALRAPDWLRLSVQHRTRYETMSSRWRAGEHGSDQQVAQRTRLLVAIRDILDPLRAVIELQDSRVQATDAGSFVDNTHVNTLDVQQLHLDLVSQDFMGTGLPSLLAVGRLNLEIGSGRWIGRNVFRNTTNAFDGAQWRVGDARHDLTVRAFVTRPVRRFMTTIDPTLPDQRHTLWGLYAESRHLSWLNVSMYYFGHDSEGPHREFSMIGTRLWKSGDPGEYEYEIESAVQTGDLGPDRRLAHFQHAEVGYTFDRPWKPQVLLRLDYAGAGLDDLYGRRNFELIPTGIFGPFERTNVISPGYRILVLPIDTLYVFAQHRAWWLAEATAPWGGSGLHDPTGSSGRYLGHTVDVRARWGATDNMFLQVGYAHFAYGSYVRRVPGGPSDRHADYAYVSAEFIF